MVERKSDCMQQESGRGVAEPARGHGHRTQSAADRLRQMIVAGEFAPGQRISEREVGSKLADLSRTPLREALKILAAEGLVTIAPNRGARVTALSLAEVDEAIEVVTALEALAAEPACRNIDAAQLAAIDALHGRMQAAYRDRELMTYFEINQEIHQAIVDAAQNCVLARIYRAECARIRRYRYAGNLSAERWQRALAEHEQIVGFLRDGKGALLREALRAHHRNGWQVARKLVSHETSQAAGKR